MTFGDAELEAGTYTVYTIPNAEKWTIIINGNTNAWGAGSYKAEKDIARLDVPAKNAAATTETLSMVFRPEDDGTTLMIGWDNTYVEIPFKLL